MITNESRTAVAKKLIGRIDAGGAVARSGLLEKKLQNLTIRDMLDAKMSMVEIQQAVAEYALTYCGLNQTEAARLLKVNRGTFRKYSGLQNKED